MNTGRSRRMAAVLLLAALVGSVAPAPTPVAAAATDPLVLSQAALSDLAQQAYAKASNTQSGDQFGSSVAISGDTMVVGATQEDSDATGAENTSGSSAGQTSDPGVYFSSGAAYVFVRVGGVWSQQAYLKASNTGDGDQFGTSVAISGDTIVVGAPFEDSDIGGVDHTSGASAAQANEDAPGAGAAYVFVRSGGLWSQQAYLKAADPDGEGFLGDNFGSSVAISGETIVVGAPGEDSTARGVENTAGSSANQEIDAVFPDSNSGAAYVFVRAGGLWSQQAYVKASNAGGNDGFGRSVGVSGDTMVVGATGEDSNATGPENTSGTSAAQENETSSGSGAAYVFVRSDGFWAQEAYVKASNTGGFDQFGASVAVAVDTIVVGAPNEGSNVPGVENTSGTSDAQANNGLLNPGAAYVFGRSGGLWSQQAYLKASNPSIYDSFGTAVAVGGETVVVGAHQEASDATGVENTAGSSDAQASNVAASAGAVYVFGRVDGLWAQRAYLKASNTDAYDTFGRSVALSGATIAVGAPAESASATGVENTSGTSPAQADDSMSGAGAAYAILGSGGGSADVAVTPRYNGPWFVGTSGTVKSLSLAGRVEPATEGCAVRFDVSGATSTSGGGVGDPTSFTTTGTSRSDGTVSAPLANVPLGFYDVTVSVTGGGCSAATSDVGSLAVSPGSVAKGSVGGGWYRLADGGGWARNDLAYVISVASRYDRKRGVTTTATQGQLVWTSGAANAAGGTGWRIRSAFTVATTDGSSIWQPATCPAGVGTTGSEPRCGTFTLSVPLEQRTPAGGWVGYGAGPMSVTVTVYDGGSLRICMSAKSCRTTELADRFGLTIGGLDAPASASQALPQTGGPATIRQGAIRTS